MYKTDMNTELLIGIKEDVASMKTSLKNMEDYGMRIRSLEQWKSLVLGSSITCSVLIPIIVTVIINKFFKRK